MPETAEERIANGIRRGAERVIGLHPTWTDAQISRALGLRRDELELVAEAREAMGESWR